MGNNLATARHAVICFEHDRRIAREVAPLCLEVAIGEVRVDPPATKRAEDDLQAFEGTIAKIGALAVRYQPTCPACREALRCVAWSIEDYEEEHS